MQGINEEMRALAAELLAQGAVQRVLGWREGDLPYDCAPAFFEKDDGLEGLVYNGFCSANLSKFLIQAAGKDGKVLVFLKPCDTYSFNQMLSEHRINREKVYVAGIGCTGMLDVEKAREQGVKGIQSVEDSGVEAVFHTVYGDRTLPRRDLLLERCLGCKGPDHVAHDRLLGEDRTPPEAEDRFEAVAELMAMTPDERFAFWRGELSKCIRCNACRNACPACSCIQCVFDNSRSGVRAKANADDFEENLFHIIRAYHVAGRCTDCGECSRVCPQGIPLHLLNRKFIYDMNDLYGEYQAGSTPDCQSPLTEYTKEDAEPSVVHTRGGAQ